MTEIEETIERGESAGILLESEAFTAVIHDLEKNYYTRWTATDTADAREQLFLKVSALKDIVAELMGWVNAREQIIMHLEDEARLSEEKFDE